MGLFPNVPGWLLLAFGQLLDLVLLIYIVLIFAWSLASLIGGDPNHPLLRFVAQLTEPPMRPLQRRMPSLGGLDFSPAVAILILFLARMLIAQPIIATGARLILGAG
jgi:YggT family protein